MFTLKTGEATQYQDDTGATLLRVPYDIISDEGETVYGAAQSFPLDATADDIRAQLQQALTVYTDDHNRYEAGKAQQAALDASAGVIEEISNVTL